MRYIALLRGVNVGGNNKVSMRSLKKCFEDYGFENVITYINSGNIIFDCEEQENYKLTKLCEELLEQEFGFYISLALIDVNSYKEAIEHAPDWWGDEPDTKHNAIFVIQPATAKEIILDVGSVKPEYEKLFVYKEAIFWSAPIHTFSRTRWSKIVGTKAYKNITIRNANTTKRILELATS